MKFTSFSTAKVSIILLFQVKVNSILYKATSKNPASNVNNTFVFRLHEDLKHSFTLITYITLPVSF